MDNARKNRIAFTTNRLALSLLLGWMGCASVAFAAAQLDSVTIGFSSFSGFYGPLWLAVEDGVGKSTEST
jgi:hypothetical protein